MSDIIACPSCERKLRVRPELQGHPVRCPSCSTTFTPAEPPPPPAPSRRRDDDEDDDRPRRSRRDEYDDEYDDRPRRRRRRDWEPHRGTMVLVLGICGMVGIFWPITSLVAWILGSADLREIREGRMDPEGESSTRIGMILGIIGTLLCALLLLGLCFLISMAMLFAR